MATNNIKPFATSSSANILKDEELATRSELQTGFPYKSKADSKLVGKLMQNATAGAYAVGEFSAKYGTTDITGSDATGFATAFESALQAYVNEKAPSPDLSAYVTKENATLTGTATLNEKEIATVDQIPDYREINFGFNTYIRDEADNTGVVVDYPPVQAEELLRCLGVASIEEFYSSYTRPSNWDPRPVYYSNCFDGYSKSGERVLGGHSVIWSVRIYKSGDGDTAKYTLYFYGIVAAEFQDYKEFTFSDYPTLVVIKIPDTLDTYTLYNYALGLKSDLDWYAPLRNAALTGTATLNGQNIATINQIPDTSHFVTDTTLASYPTSEMVEAEFSSYDKNIKAHIESELTGYAPLTGAAFSGAVTVQEPTAASNPSTKGYVDSALAAKADASALTNYAPLANPAFTGTATLGGKNLVTADQIPDTSEFATKNELSGYLSLTEGGNVLGGVNYQSGVAFNGDVTITGTGNYTINGENIATVNQIPDVSTKINISGSRGTLAGYETTSVGATALSVNQDSPDSQQLTAAVAITVSNGTENTAWVKKVSIKDAGVTISLGSAWNWAGGSQPTVTAPSLLILSWDNDCGIAILQTTGS
nr:MAG TPA: hypothetical protein [Caudoviricetes sp.]